MTKPIFQTFFTALDNDFILKGARDPLGFQVIWQHTARQLIPYLNTVCGNLRDWQILCYGHLLHSQSGTGEDIVPFFIRFEQLMAHTRLGMGDNSFNGVEKTKQIRAEGSVFRRLGNRNSRTSKFPEAELLTNQRSYGIWGKYIRPFEESQLQRNPHFETLFSSKLARISKDNTAKKLLESVSKSEGTQVRAEDLAALNDLLILTVEEANFFRETLLQHIEPSHYQNRLFEFCESGEIPSSFFQQLQAFQKDADRDLYAVLEDIRQTEQVLCPLNRAFRTLQSRGVWAIQDIEADEYLISCFKAVESSGLSGPHMAKKQELATWLALPLTAATAAMVAENAIVAAKRGGSPWMSLRGNLLEVHHTEGSARFNEEYQSGIDVDNSYFLSTYLNLYNQAKAA